MVGETEERTPCPTKTALREVMGLGWGEGGERESQGKVDMKERGKQTGQGDKGEGAKGRARRAEGGGQHPTAAAACAGESEAAKQERGQKKHVRDGLQQQCVCLVIPSQFRMR
jgi:hypothetical protein